MPLSTSTGEDKKPDVFNLGCLLLSAYYFKKYPAIKFTTFLYVLHRPTTEKQYVMDFVVPFRPITNNCVAK